MSTTTMTSANSSTVKLWEMKTWKQTMAQACLGHIFNRGGVYYPTDVGKGKKGDNVTFDYVGKLTKEPVGEGGVLSSNLEALDTTQHSMSWNVTRFGVESPNEDTIEQQRTNINFEESARAQMANRAVELLDASLFYQLAGAAPTSVTLDGTTYATTAGKLHVQGHNTPVAPSTNRIIRAASASNDDSLTSADKFKLDYIDYALEANLLSTQPIQPFADNTFDLFVSPEQLTDIMHDDAGKIQWLNIELARLTGGKDSAIDNSFKNNMVCAGKYKNVYIYAAPRVAYGVNHSTSAVITTVRRAVLVGKDAVSFSSPFGGRVTDSSVPSKIKVELKDFEYYKGLECRLLYGLKKMIPSGKEDIGVFVIATYAAAHT